VASDRSALVHSVQTIVENAKTESQKGTELFGYVKAKAQSVAEAAAAAAAEAIEQSGTPEPSARSKSAPRRRPPSRHTVRQMARRASKGKQDVVAQAAQAANILFNDAADEREVEKLTDLGWSPVAARLALCHVEGGAKEAHEWLGDEANAAELDAAEAAEIMAMEEADRRGKMEKRATGCTEDFLATEETVFEAQDEEEGRGLGMARLRQEMGRLQPLTVEPSEVALVAARHLDPASTSPGLYSRKFQKEEPDGEEDEGIPSSSADSEITPRMSDAPTQASAQQELESCTDEEHEEEDEPLDMNSEDEDAFLPEPPDSRSWEWPLSRNEKKARINLVDRQMHALDKKALIQALVKERIVARAGK